MAVIYEVTLHASNAVTSDFFAWLRGHIAAMLDIPGIEAFELHALETGSTTDRSWCVRYRMSDGGALDGYLCDHAPRMRGEGLARFGDAFRAERRILTPLDS